MHSLLKDIEKEDSKISRMQFIPFSRHLTSTAETQMTENSALAVFRIHRRTVVISTKAPDGPSSEGREHTRWETEILNVKYTRQKVKASREQKNRIRCYLCSMIQG